MSDDGKPPQPPDPDELARQIQEFMKQHFGGNFPFPGMPGVASGAAAKPPARDGGGAKPATSKQADPDVFDFHLRPADIKAHLDRYVIRQDEAKKVLAIAVCDHYNRARSLHQLEQEDPDKARQVEFAKHNMILVGPTGVGKTYLIRHIADFIGVPFVKADATKFSETGYVGGDVDDLVRDLVSKADGDVELAEHGIIYIDEIDKLASRGGHQGRDVSGRGVQTTLLKLMEETEVPARNPMDISGQMQAMFQMQRGGGKGPSRDTINTRNILFVVSGAFSGLEDIVSRRLRSGRIGFGAMHEQETAGQDEWFAAAATEDFIEYGFEAEFIGRLPVRVVCSSLSENDLFEIMTRSEGSVIRQFGSEFEAYGLELEIREDAMREVARRAVEEKTGARGLLTVWERILRDFKFLLPDSGVEKVVIDDAVMNDPPAAAARLAAEARAGGANVKRFLREFEHQHGLRLSFTTEALMEIGRLSGERGNDPSALCAELFHDYQFGLKLVRDNTGRTSFELPAKAVTQPERWLSDMVVESYRASSGSGGASPGDHHGTPPAHEG